MALLELAGITVRFGGVVAISKLDLRVDAGALVALIGPNGAGKTTGFNVITGVCAPTEGSVRFDGERIDGRPTHQICRARHRAHVPEHPPVPLAHRARERARGAGRRAAARGAPTCCAAPPGAPRGASREAQARELLARLGLARFADARADSLPYGEQRRLEIARALATRPRLLLLDEPAAGMNPSEKEALRELIVRCTASSGSRIVLIDHDIPFVMNLCERITVLDHGEKIAEGPPEAVRARPARDRGLPGHATRQCTRDAPSAAAARRVARGRYGAIRALRGVDFEVQRGRDRRR